MIVVLPLTLKDRKSEDILKENLNSGNIKNFGVFHEEMFMERRIIYEVLCNGVNNVIISLKLHVSCSGMTSVSPNKIKLC